MLNSKIFNVKLFLIVLFMGAASYAQTTVNSLSALKPYLDDNNVNIKLAPGTYTIDADDIANGSWGYTVPSISWARAVMQFSGSNSTYDFTGVTLNIDTDVFKAFGYLDIWELQITGNNNVLKNLKMVDLGSVNDAPSRGVTNVVIDGQDNVVEGFHVTVKGSTPYGYSEAFGKGPGNIVATAKHSGILIRGNDNTLRNTTLIQRAFGHCLFMQAAVNPTIEGCYVEGEMRSTDDILAEEGSGSIADQLDFMTVWGYRLPPGYMLALCEEGVRSYNAGETLVNGTFYSRGSSNIRVLNTTVKNVRVGVSLALASGSRYVENVTVLGSEVGFSLRGGPCVDCKADCIYGPVYQSTYDNDSWDADITILPPSAPYYNGGKCIAYIGSDNCDITLRDAGANIPSDMEIRLGGLSLTKSFLLNDTSQEDHRANDVNLYNYTKYPIDIVSGSNNNRVETCGPVTNNGSGNSIINSNDCEEIEVDESNLALNGIATQSSSRPSDGFANEAIDGNTNGAWANGSVTHTLVETNPWWQVDLGSDKSIGNINIFNRTDSCCSSRLSNFTVSVINSSGATTYSQTFTSTPNPLLSLNAENAVGSIIKVQLNGSDNPLSLAEVQVYEGEGASISFVPDPNKVYYIDAPQHNLRLSANGVSEVPGTTSTSTVGADVEWKFVAKGNGSWHIQRAAGGTLARLRTDNNPSSDGTAADMQDAGWNGTYTYFDFTEGAIAGTHFITLPDGPTAHVRLQIDNSGNVQMVENTRNGTWESFKITEVQNTGVPIGQTIWLKSLANDKYVRNYDTNGDLVEANTENEQGAWVPFAIEDAGNGMIALKSGANGKYVAADIGVSEDAPLYANRDGMGSWEKFTWINNSDGTISLKANSNGMFVSADMKLGENAPLVANRTAANQWEKFYWGTYSASKVLETTSNATIFPNLVSSTTTVNGAANSILNIYDMNGRVLLTKTISSESETIDLGGLAPGMYYGQVIGKTTLSVTKIVKH